MAVGAGRMRLVRQFLVESLTLGVLGGVAGLGLAFAALRTLVAIAPASLPRLRVRPGAKAAGVCPGWPRSACSVRPTGGPIVSTDLAADAEWT